MMKQNFYRIHCNYSNMYNLYVANKWNFDYKYYELSKVICDNMLLIKMLCLK